MKLFYFPDAALLCTTYDNVTFEVINGAYTFELENQIATTSRGTFSVGQYEIHTRKSFDERYPNFGY